MVSLMHTENDNIDNVIELADLGNQVICLTSRSQNDELRVWTTFCFVTNFSGVVASNDINLLFQLVEIALVLYVKNVWVKPNTLHKAASHFNNYKVPCPVISYSTALNNKLFHRT